MTSLFLDPPPVIHVVSPRCRCCQSTVMCNLKSAHSCSAPLFCAACLDAEWAREEEEFDRAWRAENSDDD